MVYLPAEQASVLTLMVRLPLNMSADLLMYAYRYDVLSDMYKMIGNRGARIGDDVCGVLSDADTMCYTEHYVI
jgi:hypothetical protein